jgi:toxin ParE1/3/4
MKFIVRKSARRDLDGIFDWISKDNPRAARRVISRILSRIARLATSDLANQGRRGLIPGTREVVERPYVIVYRVDKAAEAIVILAVVHTARDRRSFSTPDEN